MIDRRDEEKQSLQKQVLKLSEENIELTFELEQLKKTVPRLKVGLQFSHIVSDVHITSSQCCCIMLRSSALMLASS